MRYNNRAYAQTREVDDVGKTPQVFDPDRASIKELAAYVERHVADTEGALLEALEHLAMILERNPTDKKAAQVIFASAALKGNLGFVDHLDREVKNLSATWKAYWWGQRWANGIEMRDALKMLLARSQGARARRNELMESLKS